MKKLDVAWQVLNLWKNSPCSSKNIFDLFICLGNIYKTDLLLKFIKYLHFKPTAGTYQTRYFTSSKNKLYYCVVMIELHLLLAIATSYSYHISLRFMKTISL